MRWTRATVGTVAGMAAVAIVFAVLVYKRRWISDDGLIDVRVVRQILAGHGPVYNVFERAEPHTSALWTWLLALIAGVSGAEVARTALATGGLLAVGAVVIGMDAARRWHRARGATDLIVPAGVLVVLAVSPFWDFATSGLESALCLAWIAAGWWLLVSLGPDRSRRHQLAVVIVLGLGPLVRPDFGLTSIVFLGAAWLILRPAWRWTCALAGAAMALPLGYEIFRAGYYGTLVPLPALAKSASASAWGRGVDYLADFVSPYTLWLPFAALAVLLAIAIARRGFSRRDRIVLAAPLVAAALSTLYVLRVGGDFMHGRMLLPPAFLALLPAMLLPYLRTTAPVIALIVVWAVLVGRNKHAVTLSDERAGYVEWTKDKHPIDGDAYVAVERGLANQIAENVAGARRRLMSEGGVDLPLAASVDAPVVVAVGRLGVGGAVTPLDGVVADTLGLASPLGARITATNPGQTGHEKSLPWAWVLADNADPATDPVASRVQIEAARHAMRCGALAELLASTREPLTASRFWDNLTGAIGRTTLVIPSDPVEAERTFCR